MSPPPAPAAWPPAPAGWYRDPGCRHESRYWDGATWTLAVSSGGALGSDPLPPAAGTAPMPAPGRPPAGARPGAGVDPRLRPPVRAFWIGLSGLGAGVVLGIVAATLVSLVLPDSPSALLVAGQSGLWAGMVGACWLVSRRWGSGNLRRDFGLRFRWYDLPLGFGASIVVRIAAGLVVLALLAIDRRYVGSNSGEISQFRGDTLAFALVVVIACAGAPMIEELFFRGLLLRSLEPSIGWAAVPVQAAFFGLAHADPTAGWGNVGICLATAVFGIGQGMLVLAYRRLGPSVATHAFFNGLSTVVIALS